MEDTSRSNSIPFHGPKHHHNRARTRAHQGFVAVVTRRSRRRRLLRPRYCGLGSSPRGTFAQRSIGDAPSRRGGIGSRRRQSGKSGPHNHTVRCRKALIVYSSSSSSSSVVETRTWGRSGCAYSNSSRGRRRSRRLRGAARRVLLETSRVRRNVVELNLGTMSIVANNNLSRRHTKRDT